MTHCFEGAWWTVEAFGAEWQTLLLQEVEYIWSSAGGLVPPDAIQPFVGNLSPTRGLTLDTTFGERLGREAVRSRTHSAAPIALELDLGRRTGGQGRQTLVFIRSPENDLPFEDRGEASPPWWLGDTDGRAAPQG